ncbi:MAG TPA: transglycosylase SLT domain-containing protein [Roseiarcus sp.]|nr:transglycosylase SLT domain-containing protein [Roseiarcus sp.]
MLLKRDRNRTERHRSASLTWVMAGDRTGVFGRSLALACIGAVFWVLALDWTISHVRRGGASQALGERLLGDVETGDRRQLADLARRLPAHFVVPERTRDAIRNAADVVGVDPGYLFGVAALESSFNPTARARGTSATGLYQFTEGTWLRVVKVFGAKHGLGDFAAEITAADDDNVFMRRGARRQALMHMRDDPHLAALFAAELALDNEMRLESLLGRAVSSAEIYLAHFLGVASAARMIAAADRQPRAAGRVLVPAAAETNPGVFGAPDEPVSAGAIRARFERFFRDQVSLFAGT